MKNNLEWYRHFKVAHNHWKFKALRTKYGWAGEGKFWAFNNMIAGAEFASLDLSNKIKKIGTASDLDFTLTEFEEFLKYLVDPCELVDINNEVYTTEITQEDFDSVSDKRKYQKEWIQKNRRKQNRKENRKPENSTSELFNTNIDSTNELSIIDKLKFDIENGVVKCKEYSTVQYSTEEIQTLEKNLGQLIPEMIRIFKEKRPQYYFEKEKDFSACFQIAGKITESLGWDKNLAFTDNKLPLLEMWSKVVEFSNADNWFMNRSLHQLNNEFQNLYLSMVNSGKKRSRFTGGNKPNLNQDLPEGNAEYDSMEK